MRWMALVDGIWCTTPELHLREDGWGATCCRACWSGMCLWREFCMGGLEQVFLRSRAGLSSDRWLQQADGDCWVGGYWAGDVFKGRLFTAQKDWWSSLVHLPAELIEQTWRMTLALCCCCWHTLVSLCGSVKHNRDVVASFFWGVYPIWVDICFCSSSTYI